MTSSWVLRGLTGAALIGIAVVHLRIAGNYTGLGSHPLALSDQFYAQAVIAFLLTAALLVRPHLLVWLAVVAFAAGSLAVLVYSRYRCLPVHGFDGCFEETWAVQGAKAAAWFESGALVLGLAGAVLTRRVSAASAAG
ncbi:MAG: hypothetical protein WCD35_17955 [Mycobacteriales bacterium]